MIMLNQFPSPMRKNIFWESQVVVAVKDIKVVVFLPFRATTDSSPRPEPVRMEKKIFLEAEWVGSRR
jgi:hypothetical protein